VLKKQVFESKIVSNQQKNKSFKPMYFAQKNSIFGIFTRVEKSHDYAKPNNN